MTTMTRMNESTVAPACLLLAFELSERTWKLGFTVGRGQRPRVREMTAPNPEPLEIDPPMA
jgi:hypothetical protein